METLTEKLTKNKKFTQNNLSLEVNFKLNNSNLVYKTC